MPGSPRPSSQQPRHHPRHLRTRRMWPDFPGSSGNICKFYTPVELFVYRRYLVAGYKNLFSMQSTNTFLVWDWALARQRAAPGTRHAPPGRVVIIITDCVPVSYFTPEKLGYPIIYFIIGCMKRVRGGQLNLQSPVGMISAAGSLQGSAALQWCMEAQSLKRRSAQFLKNIFFFIFELLHASKMK